MLTLTPGGSLTVPAPGAGGSVTVITMIPSASGLSVVTMCLH